MKAVCNHEAGDNAHNWSETTKTIAITEMKEYKAKNELIIR